ncbi:hypothetical protein FPOAC1_011716 [Fusarium poae]|uniref:hypothetical protein n=1 Tax=Fusarium poae TaxID=36050 RepID=UPI001CE968C2|nr:hypothetical protein FPOAC1_011716 [Fusarium poae]KAG8666894.1 hypothetical protein FPOAC1_011716 [Fusarium poae]
MRSSKMTSLSDTCTVFTTSDAADNGLQPCSVELLRFVAIAQRLGVDFLFFGSREYGLPLDGDGASGVVTTRPLTAQASFSFKSFKKTADLTQKASIYRALISEIYILQHPLIKNHPNFVRLYGVGFDVARNYSDEGEGLPEIWPTLILERAKDGNLAAFLGASERTLVYVPFTAGWQAPEWHRRAFPVSSAKRMDVFTYGKLCAWILLGGRLSTTSIPLEDRRSLVGSILEYHFNRVAGPGSGAGHRDRQTAPGSLQFAFGTARNEKDSLEWLRKSGVDIEYVERKLEYVASRGSYYGPFQHDDLSEYLEYDTGWEYATTGLLDEAIAALQTEIQGKVEHTVIHSRLHLQSVLAHLLSYRGGVEDRERSLKLRIDIAQDTEQELGEEHADSLRAKAFLAVSLRNRQRAEEAEPIQRRVLEIRRKTRKSDHPDILQSMGDLAYTLSLIYPENLEESIELLQQVYESHVNIFGHSNRKTIDSLSQLIKVLDKAGKKAMTENMCRRNLDVCIPSLPARHPSIVETQITLARTLLDSGRDDEAVALAEDWIKGSAEELARIDGGIIDLVRSTLVKSVSKNQGHRWVDLAERLSSLSEMRYGSKSRDAIRDKARVGLLLYQSNRFRESQTVWKEVAHVWGNATPKNELEEINAVAFWGLSLLYNDQLEEATNVMLQLGHLSKGKDDKTVKSTVRELRRVEKACRAAGLEEQARSLAQFSDQELSTVT